MRRKALSRFSASGLSCLFIVVLLLSACGPTTTPEESANQEPVKGGTWIDDIPAAPGSLLPNGSDTTYSVLIAQALFTPLFYGDSKGKVNPGLATEIPTVDNGGASADLKTWKFKIRDGVTWSDGTPITAEDVKFTVETYQNPKFGAKFLTGIELVESMEVSADKSEITFTLREPFVGFATAFVDANPGSPLPKHHFESMDPATILQSEDNLLPKVVSGPFTVKTDETQAPNVYTLVPNEKYYRAAEGLPYLDKLVFRVVNETSTILADARAGTVTSSWFLDISQIADYESIEGYRVVRDEVVNGYEALWFNQRNEALKDVNVRTAIALAVDKQQLIEVARNGYAEPLCTIHPESIVPGYQPDVVCPEHNPDEAKRLLDEAGWVPGDDGVREKGDLRLEFAYSTTQLEWRKQDQQLIQKDLEEIGIKVNLKNYNGDTFFGSLLPQGKPGEYDIAEFMQTYNYDGDDSSTFDCPYIPTEENGFSGQNYTFTCSEEVEALHKQELSTTDPEERQEAFNKLHEIYLTENPVVVLFGAVNASIVKNTGQNYMPGPMGAQETLNVWEWWCTGGKC